MVTRAIKPTDKVNFPFEKKILITEVIVSRDYSYRNIIIINEISGRSLIYYCDSRGSQAP